MYVCIGLYIIQVKARQGRRTVNGFREFIALLMLKFPDNNHLIYKRSKDRSMLVEI